MNSNVFSLSWMSCVFFDKSFHKIHQCHVWNFFSIFIYSIFMFVRSEISWIKPNLRDKGICASVLSIFIIFYNKELKYLIKYFAWNKYLYFIKKRKEIALCLFCHNFFLNCLDSSFVNWNWFFSISIFSLCLKYK